MRTVFFFFLVLLAIGSPRGHAQAEPVQINALFVGNSLTYVGNTPAVFDALASANGSRVSSDMIVRGGATLTQRVNDGSVARALAAKHYTALVLQERGGDLMCAFGPDSCTDSRRAIQALVALARKTGTQVYLLGTYQGNPMASERIVQAESAAAAEVGIPYLEVSQKLQRLSSSYPAAAWFAPDGVHPGPELTLLNAALLHQALVQKLPRPISFTVNAPIYRSTSGLTESLRKAEDPPPIATTPRRIRYTAQSLQRLRPVLLNGAGPGQAKTGAALPSEGLLD